MTDPTHTPFAQPDPAAGTPVAGASPEAPPFNPYATPEPGPASAPEAPPTPPAAPVARKGGHGGPRVPAVLVLVLAPVLAVAMFAGGVFIERSGALGAPVDSPAPAASGAPSGRSGPLCPNRNPQGRMLWLPRNTFSGSTRRLTSARRSYVACG